MSYVKTLMEDYFHHEKEIYKPVSMKYIIYNLQNNQFRSANIPILDKQFEYLIEVLSNKDEFTIFISHSIDAEYFFIELMDCQIVEDKIYDYYDFYDVNKNDIDISQEYTVFIDCNSNVFNVTTTKYLSNKKLDTFEILHFKEIKVFI
jgi:hypothetical protein